MLSAALNVTSNGDPVGGVNTILVTPGVVVHLNITAISMMSDSGTGTVNICSPVIVNGAVMIQFDSGVPLNALAFIRATCFTRTGISTSVTVIVLVSTTLVNAIV